MARPFINFQEVKDKVSIPDVLDKLGVIERFKEKNGVWTGVCPIPTHQHGPSPNNQQFKFDNKRGPWLWRCFGDCDRGGDVIELVKAIEQLSDEHVRFWFVEHFADRLGTAKPRGERTQEAKPDESPKVAATASPLAPLRFFLNLDPSHPYLEQRNVPKDVLERYGVGYSSRPRTSEATMKCHLCLAISADLRMRALGIEPQDDRGVQSIICEFVRIRELRFIYLT